jgi:glutamate-ammonia-ligase adenylyltransferase
MAEPAKRSAKTAEKTGEPPATALVAAIKAAPKLSAAKEARARVDEWLGEIARTAAGKALKPLLAGDTKSRRAKLAVVVAAIAETSPYLWDLIRADPDRFLRVLEADPESHFAKSVAEMARAGLAEQDETEMMRVLRRG